MKYSLDFFISNIGERRNIKMACHDVVRYLNIFDLKFKMTRIAKKNSRIVLITVQGSNKKKIERLMATISRTLNLDIRETRPRKEFKGKIPEDQVKDLKCVSINVNHFKNKASEIYTLAQQENIDILCLQETHRTDIDEHLILQDYVCIEAKKKESAGANGLALWYKRDLQNAVRIKNVEDNIISISLKTSNREITVSNVYLAADKKSGLENLEEILKVIKKDEDNILIGDWNNTPEEIKRKLFEKGMDCNIENTIHKGTRENSEGQTQRRIDFALGTKRDLYRQEKARWEWRLSDHCPIEIRIKLDIPKFEEPAELFFNRNKLKDAITRNNLRNYQFSEGSSNNLANDFTSLSEEIQESLRVNNVVTIKKKRTISSIHTDASIKKLVKARTKEPSQEERNKISLQLKKEIREKRKEKYKKFLNKGIEVLKNKNNREAWKFIKTHSRLNKGKAADSPFRDTISKELISDPQEKANIAGEHIQQLTKEDDESKSTGPYTAKEEIAFITDKDIDWQEIREALKACDNNKAAGSDLIPCEYYKLMEDDETCTYSLSKKILGLLRELYKNAMIPKEWESSTFVLIYKKGDPTSLDNYRGIALINTLSKILMKVLAKRLSKANQEYNLVRKEQIGFIPNEEGLSGAMAAIEICQRRELVGERTLMCFLDLKKAFDRVPHRLLIDKLKRKGLGPLFIRMIEALYEKSILKVRIDNKLSKEIKYERGVRQGCPLSPMLFDIFIDDLLDGLETVPIPGLETETCGQCFADDTLIFAKDETDLKRKLAVIRQWMTVNRMEVNSSKCGVIAYPRNESDPMDIEYGDERIPYVTKYTYLGYDIDNELSEENAAKARIGVGYQTLDTIESTLRSKEIPMEYKALLITRVLLPRTSYGINIYGGRYSNLSQIKTVLNKGLGWAVGKTTFSRERIYEEMGIPHIEAMGRYFLAKSFKSWANSKGIAGDLIRKEVYIKETGSKTVRRTWCNKAHESIKKNGLENINSKKELKAEVARQFKTKKKFNKPNDTNITGERLKLGNGKDSRKKELNTKDKRVYEFVQRCRMGTLLRSEDFNRLKKLKETNIGRCITCGCKVKDTLEHTLLHCNALQEERKELITIGKIRMRSPNKWKDTIMSFLLEGKLPTGASREEMKEMNREKRKYLEAIVEKRTAGIRNCLK
jgi:exonuclease III